MEAGQTAHFPRWKLRPPVVPDYLSVHPMAAHLTAALERVPYVSVVAPAGSGKTTALAAWSAASTLPTLWVRLDPQDNDPLVLAAALDASSRHNFARPAARIAQLLSSLTTPDVTQLAIAASLDLDDLGPVAVVLDDLQHLRAAQSLQLVAALLDDLGPEARLVTASRLEPPFDLPQRRVRRTVAEVSATDLRLDRSQIAALLGDVDVHDEAFTDAILDRSHGWAAAAVLLATHTTPGPAPTGAPAPVSLAGDTDIDAFLRAEVLEPMDDELRDFVLETSLLTSLDAESCAAVTNSPRSAELLERVRRHALVEQVDAPAGDHHPLTLRYHDRIAAFLREELATNREAAQRRELHRRAAAVSPPHHAIELLLAVDEVDEASRIVTEVGRSMLDTPGARVPRSWLTPFDAEQIVSQPWPALLAGLAALEDGDIKAAMRSLPTTVDALRAQGDRAGLVHGACGLAETHLAWGQVDEAAALVSELLDLETTPDERAKVLMGSLWLDYFGGEWTSLASSLDEAFTLALTACTEVGRCSVALGLGTEFLFAPTGAGWFSDRAAELARRIDQDIMARTNLELIGAAAHLVAGRIEQAQAVSFRLDERALELGSLNWLAMAADRVRLGVALATGDDPAVDAIVDGARRLLPTSDRHRQERAMYAYALARSGSPESRSERVRAARVLLGEVTADDRPDTVVTSAILAAMVQRADGRLDGAAETLEALGDLHRQVRFCLLTGLVDLELAAIYLESGRRSDALDAARPTLVQLGELEGLGLLLIDGAATHRAVLEACGQDPDAGPFAASALRCLATPLSASGIVVAETGERLTTRELDVLRLVVAGRSNRAIGEELFIGERTVKSHMTSLMRKLGVTSRTAAIARSRELNIT